MSATSSGLLSGKELPLFSVIETEQNWYLYDTATNQILKISEESAHSLKKREFTESDLAFIRAHSNAGVLCSPPRNGLKSPETIASVTQSIQEECSQIVLEASQNCNLRCRYCVYSGLFEGRRTHNPIQMSSELAFQAVDYLDAHSKKLSQVFVGFYGGEPLLNLKLIKNTVNYALEKIGRERVAFTITTNGTLLSQDVMQFLVDNQFHVHVSIDGPEEIHNQYRLFATNDSGSFDTVYTNLRNFQLLYPEYFKAFMRFSMVIPPGSDLTVIARMLTQWNIKSVNLATISAYGTAFEKEYRLNPIKGETFLLKRFVDAGKNNELRHSLHTPEFLLQRALYSSLLFRIINRLYPLYPTNTSLSLGACIPGSRKLFVDVHGDIYPCERTDGSAHLKLGNIVEGIDPSHVFGLMKHFFDFTAHHCASCWLYRLCPVCFVEPSHGNMYSETKLEAVCIQMRKRAEIMLQVYCTILEADSTALECYRE